MRIVKVSSKFKDTEYINKMDEATLELLKKHNII